MSDDDVMSLEVVSVRIVDVYRRVTELEWRCNGMKSRLHRIEAGINDKIEDDNYPIEKYRQARLTLMHMYIYDEDLDSLAKAAIMTVLSEFNRLIPEEK